MESVYDATKRNLRHPGQARHPWKRLPHPPIILFWALFHSLGAFLFGLTPSGCAGMAKHSPYSRKYI